MGGTPLAASAEGAWHPWVQQDPIAGFDVPWKRLVPITAVGKRPRLCESEPLSPSFKREVRRCHGPARARHTRETQPERRGPRTGPGHRGPGWGRRGGGWGAGVVWGQSFSWGDGKGLEVTAVTAAQCGWASCRRAGHAHQRRTWYITHYEYLATVRNTQRNAFANGQRTSGKPNGVRALEKLKVRGGRGASFRRTPVHGA